MPLYVTKIIRNIHWNHNDTYNLVVYLFIFNNYDTINDESVIVPPLCSITVRNDIEAIDHFDVCVNYRHYKEILMSLSP